MTSLAETIQALAAHGKQEQPFAAFAAALRELADDIDAGKSDALQTANIITSGAFSRWIGPGAGVRWVGPGATRPAAEIRAEITRLEALTHDKERAAHAISFSKWTIGDGDIEPFQAASVVVPSRFELGDVLPDGRILSTEGPIGCGDIIIRLENLPAAQANRWEVAPYQNPSLREKRLIGVTRRESPFGSDLQGALKNVLVR